MLTVHRGSFWAADNGIELPLVYLVAANTLAITGPGTASVDAVTGFSLPMPVAWLGGLVLVILGVATALGTAQRPAVAAPVVTDGPAAKAA